MRRLRWTDGFFGNDRAPLLRSAAFLRHDECLFSLEMAGVRAVCTIHGEQAESDGATASSASPSKTRPNIKKETRKNTRSAPQRILSQFTSALVVVRVNDEGRGPAEKKKMLTAAATAAPAAQQRRSDWKNRRNLCAYDIVAIVSTIALAEAQTTVHSSRFFCPMLAF